jgi:hypothetical protein
MNKAESKEQATLPPCPNPGCREAHVVRNGSHRGRQRYYRERPRKPRSF